MKASMFSIILNGIELPRAMRCTLPARIRLASSHKTSPELSHRVEGEGEGDMGEGDMGEGDMKEE